MTDESARPADAWQPASLQWSWDPAANAAARDEARGPRVPAGPRWLPWAAGLAGLVGAVALPGAPPGLGVVITVAAVAAALAPALRAQFTPWTVGAGTLALVLVGLTGVRDAEWLVALNVLAGFALGSIVLAGGSSFRGLVRGAASVVLAAPMAPAHAGRPLVAGTSRARIRGLGPAFRGAIVSVALLVVFGALFASADAVFGDLAGRLLPSMSLADAPVRVFVFLAVAGLVASGAVVAAGIEPVGLSRGLHGLADLVLAPLDPARARTRRNRVEWVLPLVVLNVLFALFVAVQFTVFFGGRTHLVTTPGLTAAEYARSGFFQLLAVCLLTLAVVATAVSRVSADERTMLRALLGPLCVMTGVVLVSAALRLRHYEDAFGYTRLRLFVAAAIAVIAAVLVMLLVAGARWRARWLPRAAVGAAAAALLALNVINADAFIARRNIDRARTGAPLDTYYLGTLSADAVPEIARLPEPARSCVLAAMRVRLDRLDDAGWRGANLSRSAARSQVANATGPSCTS